MDVEVVCAEPDSIRVSITATAALGEWREISKRIRGSDHQAYSPLNDLLASIDRAVRIMHTKEPVPPPLQEEERE